MINYGSMFVNNLFKLIITKLANLTEVLEICSLENTCGFRNVYCRQKNNFKCYISYNFTQYFEEYLTNNIIIFNNIQ